MQTVDQVIAANILRLRDERQLSVRTLANLLGLLGVRMLPSAITQIENGKRRVSASELIVFAIALKTTPNRLLFPMAGDVALTSIIHASQEDAWNWARGDQPLANTGELTSDEFIRRTCEGGNDGILD